MHNQQTLSNVSNPSWPQPRILENHWSVGLPKQYEVGIKYSIRDVNHQHRDLVRCRGQLLWSRGRISRIFQQDDRSPSNLSTIRQQRCHRQPMKSTWMLHGLYAPLCRRSPTNTDRHICTTSAPAQVFATHLLRDNLHILPTQGNGSIAPSVRMSQRWWKGGGFDSHPLRCRVQQATQAYLPLSPISSVIWYYSDDAPKLGR